MHGGYYYPASTLQPELFEATYLHQELQNHTSDYATNRVLVFEIEAAYPEILAVKDSSHDE